MSLRRSATALLIVGALAWQPTGAGAQDAEADALIDQGVTLREQGRDAEARDLFARAHERSPSARALAQLALAEQALGEWVRAHAHMTEALTAGGAWIAERRQPLEQALARISEHVGHLELVDGVEGAEVRVNGEPAGTLPLDRPLTVPAGTVVLEVTAPGHVAMRRTIELRGGARARERVVLVASTIGVSAASDTPQASPSGSGDGLVAAAIGSYAVAGAGLAVMAIFGGLAASSHDTLARGCGSTSTCTPSDVADTNTSALVSDLGLGAALAGAAVGTILLVVGLSAEGDAVERASLTPWFTRDGAGAAARLRF